MLHFPGICHNIQSIAGSPPYCLNIIEITGAHDALVMDDHLSTIGMVVYVEFLYVVGVA